MRSSETTSGVEGLFEGEDDVEEVLCREATLVDRAEGLLVGVVGVVGLIEGDEGLTKGLFGGSAGSSRLSGTLPAEAL